METHLTLLVLISLATVVALVFFVLNKYKLFYSKQKVDQEQILFQKVAYYLSQEKSYLDPTLRLSHLAKQMNIPERVLSQVVNKYAKQNFNTYINKFRIEHTIGMIESEDFNHYTIDAIASESGFANKVSFYKAFKKKTGLSPAQYRNKVLKVDVKI